MFNNVEINVFSTKTPTDNLQYRLMVCLLKKCFSKKRVETVLRLLSQQSYQSMSKFENLLRRQDTAVQLSIGNPLSMKIISFMVVTSGKPGTRKWSALQSNLLQLTFILGPQLYNRSFISVIHLFHEGEPLMNTGHESDLQPQSHFCDSKKLSQHYSCTQCFFFPVKIKSARESLFWPFFGFFHGWQSRFHAHFFELFTGSPKFSRTLFRIFSRVGFFFTERK